MFAALGVGAWEVAFFHLVTHAAFKSLLFLASGSVIHGAGTQDLREMGGLRRTMPVTFAVWLVGGAALVGIPPLAGFFSKDAVLDAVWIASPAAGVLLFAAALLTGFYTVRATKLAFFGAVAWAGPLAREPRYRCLCPLVILAVPAATLGFAGAWIAQTLGEHPEPLSIPLSAVAVTVGLVGGAIAWKTVRSESKEPQLSGAAAWRLAPARPGLRLRRGRHALRGAPHRRCCAAGCGRSSTGSSSMASWKARRLLQARCPV